MRIVIAELLAFAYNLEYLLRLTKPKYTHIFIVDFHGSRIYQMKENIMFFIVMYCCYGMFLHHELKKTLKDLTVRWLIEKNTTTLLEEKNFFSLLRVYEQVLFLSRLHNRQVWSPGIPPLPPLSYPKHKFSP